MSDVRLSQPSINPGALRGVFTTELSQLVPMAIPSGEEIGEETHEGIDQVLAFSQAKAKR
jgi:hypothetical protein